MPSTVIRRFHYDAQGRALLVTFTTGRRYRYRDVPPEAAEALKASFAKGIHFNRHIRGRYRFEELAAEHSDADAERVAGAVRRAGKPRPASRSED